MDKRDKGQQAVLERPKRKEGQKEGNLLHVQETRMRSGPLPEAGELENYERTCTGAADRIIVMAEQQLEHRHKMESSVVNSNIKNERLGMHYSFILTILLMAFGGWMIMEGKDIAGYLAIFLPVLFHGGNYVYQKNREVKHSEK